LDSPVELPHGIRRITTPLPTRPGHVHSYLLPGDGGGGWTLVDTGIGLPDAQEVWAESLGGAEVGRIFVTHFHPDHVGAAADVHELTGAPVSQGALDYAQCELVWGNPNWPHRIAEWFVGHGVPAEVTDELIQSGDVYRPFIRFQRDPLLVDDGDELDGWELVAAPGHADGQLCLLKAGILVSADHLLGRSSPSPSRCSGAPPAAPTRSRSTSSAPSSSPPHAGSPSRRRSRTWSASCSRSVPRGTRTTGPLPILRASLDEPSSTHAPESGA
jgi:glyoxylase-like metal-dependent hydrolase (beta-lactamase superfamily II)